MNFGQDMLILTLNTHTDIILLFIKNHGSNIYFLLLFQVMGVINLLALVYIPCIMGKSRTRTILILVHSSTNLDLMVGVQVMNLIKLLYKVYLLRLICEYGTCITVESFPLMITG